MTALRVGVLFEEHQALTAWEMAVLNAIEADERLVLSAILTQKSDTSGAGSLAFKFVTFFDKRVFARRWTRTEGSADDVLDVVARADTKDADAVRDRVLDVIVKLCPGPMEPRLLDDATFGVWSLDFLCATPATSATAGFAEAVESAPVTSAALVRLTEDPASVDVLATASGNTKPSAARNRAYLTSKCAQLIVRELGRLAQLRRVEPRTRAQPVQERSEPRALAVMNYVATLGAKLAERAIYFAGAPLGLRPQMWTLMFGKGTFETAKLTGAVDANPPRDQLWADPFLLERDGVLYVFFENYSYRRGRAHISVGRLDGDTLTVLGDALHLETHLSYPFVFTDGDEIYMMPENHQADRLEIWRCTDFPLKWELHATALEGRTPADSSMIKDGDTWWIFTNLSDPLYPDHCSELSVFAADGPDLKSVTEHKNNPVVIDTATARGGGRPFARNGRLYRPSQRNTDGRYGSGLNIMEIRRLDLDEYQEVLIRTIEPDAKSGLIGCHHFDAVGERWVVDACHAWGGFGERVKSE